MITGELIDAVKAKLGAKSYYEVAKKTGIDERRISEYRKGRTPDEYACFKFAEILGRSPSSVIAEVLAEKEKDEDKRLYFKRFFTIAGLWITLGLLSPQISTNYGVAQAGIDNAKPRAVITFQPIMRRTGSFMNVAYRPLKRPLSTQHNDSLRVMTNTHWHPIQDLM